MILQVVIFALFLCACGYKPKAEAEVKQDIIEQFGLWNEIETSFVIDERTTNKKEKYDRIKCTFKSEDDTKTYERTYSVYNVLGDDGWSAVGMSLLSERTLPKKGVDIKEISNAIWGESIQVGNEFWTLSESSSCSVETQITDIENGTDNITVNMVIDEGGSMIAEGKAEASYIWNGDEWKYNGLNYQINNFSARFKEGKEKICTQNELINLLVLKNVVWDTGTVKQDISIKPEEISNFEFECKPEYSNKGCTHIQKCGFILDKGWASFYATATLSFEFAHNEWQVSGIWVDLKVRELNLTGKWSADYKSSSSESQPNMTAYLTIDSQAADGTLLATMEFYPRVTNLSNSEGSFRMRGGVDLKTLEIKLEPIEWIRESKGLSLFKVIGQIYIENAELNGTFSATFARTNVKLKKIA